MATATSIQAPKVNTDWWQNAVIYQIYPRSFMDSNDDGVGDLKGITSKLEYLADTGITATWLSPIFQSPMVDFGYDISNFKAIHHEYGTMEDFVELISEAKRLGIEILLDFVPNHSSDKCDWFLKSADRVKGFEDFYVWADGKVTSTGDRLPPNNWQSVFRGSAWTWHEKRQQYYLHQFAVQQPDLNYRNPKVVETMDEVLHFWLDKGISGFRVDAVNHLYESAELLDEPLTGKTQDVNSYDYTEHIHTKNLPECYEMVQHWRRLLDDYTAAHGGVARIMMTEAYADVKPLMDYYESRDGVRGAHFPFNFFFVTDLNATSDARDFVFNIQKWLTYMPRGHVANWVMGNHDQPRIASRFGAELVDAMNMLLLTLPGVAVTYNGEEIGMQDYRQISWQQTVDPPARNAGEENYREVSRDPVRTPFQWSSEKCAGFSAASHTWLPVHPNYIDLNLKSQRQAAKSHYKVYKRLVQLRKLPVLSRGRFAAAVLNRDVFAFKRELKGHDTLITIINVGATPQIVNLTDFVDVFDKFVILASGVDSVYEIGFELQSIRDFSIGSHEGVVCMIERKHK